MAHCSFVKYDIYYDLTVHDGLFNYKISEDSCEPYSKEGETPNYMKAAGAFGILLVLGLSAALILTTIVVLAYPNRTMWITYRVLLGFCFAFNTGTFAMFGECLEIESIQCSPGGAGVLAILNALLLVATFILACIIPVPEESIFKIGAFRDSSTTPTTATNNDTPVATVKRTVEETPTGNKITEEVTDEAGVTTITTTFEPIAPVVKTTVMDLPNGTKTVEEDAQGNKTITTRIVDIAGQHEEEAYGIPEPVDGSENNYVMAAAVVPEASLKQSLPNMVYQNDAGAERGGTNPSIENQQDVRRSKGRDYSDQLGQGSNVEPRQSNPSSYTSSTGMNTTRNQVSHNAAPGHDSGLDKPGRPTPRDMSSYLENSSSSAFTGSINYDNSFMASSATFGARSGNFDASYAPGDSSALDGVDGERRLKKKKKKHKHHRREHDHSSSSHRKREMVTDE